MDAATIAVIVFGILDIPLFILIGKFLFGSWGDFWDSVMFWLTPDFCSLLNGEYWDDMKAELKLGVFVALCVGAVLGEIMLIAELFITAPPA